MEISVLIFAVLVAYTIKGLTGFANTLIVTTISGFVVDNVVITPIELLLTIPSNVIILFKNRNKVDWKTAVLLSVLVILGSIPGAFMLQGVDQTALKIFFGFVVVIVGIEMLFRKPSEKEKKPHPIFMIITGLISGVLCGLFGVGALLTAYVSRTTKDVEAFKGTLCIVFIVDNLFRFILYISTGIITFATVQSFLWLTPVMFLGLFIGMHFAKKVKETTVKKCVIILLIFSGLSLILTNII